MSTIVCNTKFKLDPFADGGSKRSVQIRQLYEEANLSFIEDDFALPKDLSTWQLTKLAFRAMGFIHRLYPSRIKSVRRYVSLVKYYALRIPIVLDKYKDQDVIFSWENTNDRDMLYLMKAAGHKVIGLPHNLESLVSSHSVHALESEVENLRDCDEVFTIAKEEAWLLRLLGLNAHYFPYFPPREVVEKCEQIHTQRAERGNKLEKHFLLLGSASNGPTKVGMQDLVDYMGEQKLPFHVSVAGFETEKLKRVENSNIEFRGTLSNEDLEALLLEVDALLIYQPPTTGSLTRIPEMLIAGIPVFVNFDAARDYHHVEDVIEYGSFDDLFACLQSFSPHQAKRLERNVAAEKECIERCRAMAEK